MADFSYTTDLDKGIENLFAYEEAQNTAALAVIEAEEKAELAWIDNDIIVNLAKPGAERHANRRRKVAKAKAKAVKRWIHMGNPLSAAEKTAFRTHAGRKEYMGLPKEGIREVLNLGCALTGVSPKEVILKAMDIALNKTFPRVFSEEVRHSQISYLKKAFSTFGLSPTVLKHQLSEVTRSTSVRWVLDPFSPKDKSGDPKSRHAKAIRQGWQKTLDIEPAIFKDEELRFPGQIGYELKVEEETYRAYDDWVWRSDEYDYGYDKPIPPFDKEEWIRKLYWSPWPKNVSSSTLGELLLAAQRAA